MLRDLRQHAVIDLNTLLAKQEALLQEDDDSCYAFVVERYGQKCEFGQVDALLEAVDASAVRTAGFAIATTLHSGSSIYFFFCLSRKRLPMVDAISIVGLGSDNVFFAGALIDKLVPPGFKPPAFEVKSYYPFCLGLVNKTFVPKTASQTPVATHSEFKLKSTMHFHQVYSTIYHQLKSRIEQAEPINSCLNLVGMAV
jgi:hypothetical protein